MKNFRKRFNHAANNTFLKSMKIDLSKRFFMGKRIFAGPQKCFDTPKTFIMLPVQVVSPFAYKSHPHRANRYFIKKAFGLVK